MRRRASSTPTQPFGKYAFILYTKERILKITLFARHAVAGRKKAATQVSQVVCGWDGWRSELKQGPALIAVSPTGGRLQRLLALIPAIHFPAGAAGTGKCVTERYGSMIAQISVAYRCCALRFKSGKERRTRRENRVWFSYRYPSPEERN